MPLYPIFENIAAAAANDALRRAERRVVETGDFVLREGEVNETLFLIESGALTVLKSAGSSDDVEVATLGPGDCFGEISVLVGGAASASLRAASGAVVLSIRLATIPDKSVRSDLVVNIARILATRLSGANTVISRTHEQKMRSMRRQLAAADFLTKSLVLLSTYMLIMPFAGKVNTLIGSTSAFSTLAILMFFAATYEFLRSSGVSPAAYGMGLDGLGDKLRVGVLWSLPFIGFLVALKYFGSLLAPGIIHVVEPNNRQNLVETDSWLVFFAVVAIYVLLTFAQEFIRCSVQSSLDLFRESDDTIRRGSGAMLVANVVFAALHIHLGPMFSLGAFITGLFWGWMYMRTGSYWASSFSHVLVGTIGIFVLGIPSLKDTSAPAPKHRLLFERPVYARRL
jgi:CRP-like cAMP-binding protein